MPETPLPLAAAFGTPDRNAWLNQVEKTLKGAKLDSLVSHLSDGIDIQPLYSASNAPGLPSWRASSADRAWDVRTQIDAPTSADANAMALGELAGGANSIVISGAALLDLERALRGVLLEIAPVALDAGFAGPKAADALANIAKSSPGALLALHLDPLSALAVAGASPDPIEDHLTTAATVAARLAEIYPKASLVMASGRAVHEAGGSESSELAFALACALTYAKALTCAGLPITTALGGVVLGLSADADYFLTTAKLRAARRLWARLCEAVGVSVPAKIEATSSARMLTQADAWTNMVRLTAAGFAAAIGGADAIILAPFTQPLGAPTPFARRQARNAQLVLMEEAHLGRVEDPAGGAGYLEALTDALARQAWHQFQAIESAGGVVRALESGLIAASVAKARDATISDLKEGRRKLLGVTDFVATDIAVPETAPLPGAPNSDDAPPPGTNTTCPPLKPWRFEEALR